MSASSAPSLILLPSEIVRNIIRLIILESEHLSDLQNFMLTCKILKAIGDPMLYRSVLLGHISDIKSFAFYAQLIAREKASFVRSVELPDAFPVWTTSSDALMGRQLLESLTKLTKISISLRVHSNLESKPRCQNPPLFQQPPFVSSSSSVIPNPQSPIASRPNSPSSIENDPHGGSTAFLTTTAPFKSFWTVEMFEGLPFRLKQLVGAFRNADATAALLSSQPFIYEWVAPAHLAAERRQWSIPSLQAMFFDFSKPIYHGELGWSSGDPKLRSRIRKLIIRGNASAGVSLLDARGLPSFKNVAYLSIGMLKHLHMTQYEMLRQIMVSLPNLLHLTFWTFGKGAAAIGAERQRHMARLDPFLSLSQLPQMPGLRSIIIIIQHGAVPDIALDDVASLMKRSPQLDYLDIVPMRGPGQAYLRAHSGRVYRSWEIISNPDWQDDWL